MERSLFSKDSSIGQLIRDAGRLLEESSSSPRLDAELLMAKVLGLTRTSVVLRLPETIAPEDCEDFCILVERRRRGEPLAYITGEREFWGLSFAVGPQVLVPRPESELMVEKGLEVLRGASNPKVVDLGTGSGCLIISLVHELIKTPGVIPSCVAVDSSVEALKVAQRNAERLGVDRFIRFVESDWFSSAHSFNPPYDLVLANPPYIDTLEQVPVELTFEPPQALFAEQGGLREVARIFSQSKQFLKPGGVLLCEVGAGKRGLLQKMPEIMDSNWKLELLGDFSSADSFTVLLARTDVLSGYY